jgi:nitroreductase
MTMNTTSPSSVIDALTWRYAVKKFDASKKIPAATWAALEEATVLSPSSYGLQPWRFFVVDDPAIRAQLRPASWNQSQITDASHLLVFARRATMTTADVDAYVNRMVEVRGGDAAALADYRKMMLGHVTNPALDVTAWATKQVYIALGVFLAAAAMMGVDSCPMEGFLPAEYDRILKLPEQGFHATVVATAGYRAADDMFAGFKKVRWPMNEAVTHI